MSGFSADWLALREPVDALARNQELTAQLIAWRRQPGFLSVLDLGSGTGANSSLSRALAERSAVLAAGGRGSHPASGWRNPVR
jgi:hypothetical protein